MRDELGTTGKAIWDAYEAANLDAGSRALVHAYARAADVADRLDGLATGRQDSWVVLTFDDMGEIHLSVDKILDQLRAQLLAVKTIYAELRQAGIRPTKTESKPTTQADEEPTDMLTKRRKEREERERKLG